MTGTFFEKRVWLMRIGITLRNMGRQSTAGLMADCARAAETAGLASLWITDHIAIPPDDAEGSGGRYLDTLVTLGWLAAHTRTIRLGSGVLILPYRPPLPTAKAIATVQELSGGRLLLGVGVGWMQAEFDALGVPRAERGKRTDETLEFLRRCFDDEVTHANGQPFLFRPQPARPPIYIGGAPPHAIPRTVRHGDGWLPMGTNPERLRAPVAQLAEQAAAAGRPTPAVIAMGGLPLEDPGAALARCQALAELGVAEVVCGGSYNTYSEYAVHVERLARLQARL